MVKLSDIPSSFTSAQEALQRAVEPFERIRHLHDQRDPFQSLAHRAHQMEQWARPYREFEEHARVAEATLGGRFEIMQRMEQAQTFQAGLAVPRWLTDPHAMAQVHSGQADRISEMARLPSFYSEAVRAAEFSGRYGVPEGLNAFRLSQEAITERLALAGPAVSELRDQWGTAEFGSAFAAVSAFSERLSQREVIGREEIGIASQLSASGLPGWLGVAATRSFLDAAGLVPPLSRSGMVEAYLRSPRVRLIGKAERRQRLGMMKREETAPRHVMKAYGLIHKTERVLRRVIDNLMTLTYGDDWPQQRLILCGCKTLVKKWELHGGDVLDHADWAQYSHIMSHPQHHADVFGAGFEDVPGLVALLNKARTLRAAVGHVRSFTPQNLLDLRLVFTTLEEGLADAMPAFQFQ